MQYVTVYGHDEVASFAPTIGDVLSKPFRIGEITKNISKREITNRRPQVDVEKSVATLRAVHKQERGIFARAQSRYTASYATQLHRWRA
ncbi:unnamed protein product [Kuraishia capsulata CBS 1993]|uniref:Uncharacterized protein n=1 Tax=Kuraishia capsulata CBS 1993 TaxID=1382522 RepID=W6MFF0_9ASCO|nr:uncharacterized protein KUCA_T00000003001 [Kuraishia capsulata CBS 1993]CDK24043.1 unnamed protein product [Kuraishia capsulata CBS 1993]